MQCSVPVYTGSVTTFLIIQTAQPFRGTGQQPSSPALHNALITGIKKKKRGLQKNVAHIFLLADAGDE